jgi:signal transduction histidine kinase
MTKPPGYFWQGTLLLLPVVLLASFSVFFLIQERERTERDLRHEAAEEVNALVEGLAATVHDAARQAYGPEALPSLERFLYPLYPEAASASESWTKFLKAQERCQTDAIEGAAQLMELADDTETISPAGIPLSPLVYLALMRQASSNEARIQFARTLIRQAIYSTPSQLTTQFITATADFLPLQEWERAQEHWQRHERIRGLLREHGQNLGGWHDALWFDNVGTTSAPFPFAIDAALLEKTIRTFLNARPSRFQRFLTIDDKQILEESGPILSQARNTPFILSAAIKDRDAFFASQRRQSWLFSSLIVGASLAAGVGVWASRRAYLRQHALNALKGNFVSSVSHELRAPIASVRLLAERLSKPHDVNDTKQREYAKFIVDECQRLTALVQNILEFSRLDQGRQSYTFEESEIERLVIESVRLMEPLADKREIELSVTTESITPLPVIGGCPIDR